MHEHEYRYNLLITTVWTTEFQVNEHALYNIHFFIFKLRGGSGGERRVGNPETSPCCLHPLPKMHLMYYMFTCIDSAVSESLM